MNYKRKKKANKIATPETQQCFLQIKYYRVFVIYRVFAITEYLFMKLERWGWSLERGLAEIGGYVIYSRVRLVLGINAFKFQVCYVWHTYIYK